MSANRIEVWDRSNWGEPTFVVVRHHDEVQQGARSILATIHVDKQPRPSWHTPRLPVDEARELAEQVAAILTTTNPNNNEGD